MNWALDTDIDLTIAFYGLHVTRSILLMQCNVILRNSSASTGVLERNQMIQKSLTAAEFKGCRGQRLLRSEAVEVSGCWRGVVAHW